MTLYTTDYLEYYLTLVGWLISNGIWNTLADTGLFALPFLAIFTQEWLKARGEGVDEGNKGVLSAVRIESRFFISIFVILFAIMPFKTIDLSTTEFDTTRSTQCQVNTPKPSETGWGTSFTTLNGQSAKVPLWWALIHVVSKGFTSAAVAAIPCGLDLRQMRMDVNATRINDTILTQEVADFTHDCYGPARAKLFMDKPTLDADIMNDVNWIGSNYFLSSSGYYNYFHSSTPRAGWPYSESRDSGLAKVASNGGYPKCNEWWSGGDKSLKARLLTQVSPDLIEQFFQWGSFLNHDAINDSIIRDLVSPRQQRMTQGHVYTDYGGQIDKTDANDLARIGGDVGMAVGSTVYFPAMDVVRQALPMVLSFLKMALVILMPIVLVFGMYDLKTLMTTTFMQFGLFFVDFWFQLARWVDSTILDALYGANSPHSTFNPAMGLNNTTSDMLLNFVMGAMFLVLPAFWMTALTWAGIKTGGVLSGLSEGTQGAKDAGGKGAGTMMKAI